MIAAPSDAIELGRRRTLAQLRRCVYGQNRVGVIAALGLREATQYGAKLQEEARQDTPDPQSSRTPLPRAPGPATAEGGTNATERAARLFEAARLKFWGRLRAIPGACPLCGESAMILDWWPHADWTVIEECPCNGFFVWTDLVKRRLPRLSANARHNLAVQVREGRTKGREVWITTGDGQFGGPIVIRSQRPSPP